MRRVLVFSAIVGACVIGGRFVIPVRASAPTASITVDYPSQGSLFPPDIIAPLFQWRDTAEKATIWRIEVHFAEDAPKVELWSEGEAFHIRELDTSLVGFVQPTLTAEQAAAHTWRQ